MKVHRYQVEGYDNHGRCRTQNMLFIPGYGIVGYRDKKQIDFFSDEAWIVEQTRAILEGKGKGKYLGEIEVPDEEVLKVVSIGKSLNQTKEDFQRNVKSLIEKIE